MDGEKQAEQAKVDQMRGMNVRTRSSPPGRCGIETEGHWENAQQAVEQVPEEKHPLDRLWRAKGRRIGQAAVIMAVIFRV